MDPQLQLKTLETVTRIQQSVIANEPAASVFDRFLAAILELTESEYGFIGEILRTPDGDPFLKTHAITNIAWNEATHEFYDENAPDGLEFLNLETLFGHTLRTGERVLTNTPSSHPRSGGIPEGHPDLNAYLGIPLRETIDSNSFSQR